MLTIVSIIFYCQQYIAAQTIIITSCKCTFKPTWTYYAWFIRLYCGNEISNLNVYGAELHPPVSVILNRSLSFSRHQLHYVRIWHTLQLGYVSVIRCSINPWWIHLIIFIDKMTAEAVKPVSWLVVKQSSFFLINGNKICINLFVQQYLPINYH